MATKINPNPVKALRKRRKLTQVKAAKLWGISLRTLNNVEGGAPVSEDTYRKIFGVFVDANKDLHDIDIAEMLSFKEEKDKYYGKVDTSDIINDELECYLYNGDMPAKIFDPYTEEDRKLSIDDYIEYSIKATPIQPTIEGVSKIISDKTETSSAVQIWTPSATLINEKGLLAIDDMTYSVSSYEGSFKSTSLSSVSEKLKAEQKLINAYLNLNNEQYHILHRRIEKFDGFIDIFFIDDLSVESIQFKVKGLHPKFMDLEETPFFSLREETNGLYLQDVPAIYNANNPDFNPINGEIIKEYPHTKAEKDWCNLSLKGQSALTSAAKRKLEEEWLY